MLIQGFEPRSSRLELAMLPLTPYEHRSMNCIKNDSVLRFSKITLRYLYLLYVYSNLMILQDDDKEILIFRKEEDRVP